MPLCRRFLPKWLKAAAAAILILAPFSSGSAQEVEVGDQMAVMETAFIELVKSVLIVPVQESLDDPNFDVVRKQVAEIIKTARRLPAIENYKDDSSFRNFALELEKRGMRLADFAQKEQTDASVAALIKIQAACLQCHRNFRF